MVQLDALRLAYGGIRVLDGNGSQEIWVHLPCIRHAGAEEFTVPTPRPPPAPPRLRAMRMRRACFGVLPAAVPML